ncbi:MAG: glycosyltransferase family 1 protein [Novosphingobium sp.]|nr:glycosyltransferase family 1 protein [Novosphingobium sp.]
MLIDASSVTRVPDGLSTYIVQLIRYLPAAAPEIEFTALLNPGVSREDLAEAIAHGRMKVLVEPVAAIGPRRDWQMRTLLCQWRDRFDLIHITSMTYPLALAGGVCTIHDLTYRKWFHGGWLFRTAARAYLDLVIRTCIRRSSAIIAVSEQTGRDVAELAGKTLAELPKIVVIHEGWEHMATRTVGDPAPAEVPQRDFLFFLGTNRAHKNLTNLLLAFERALPRLPAAKTLVITGSSAKLDASQKAIVDRVNAVQPRIVFTGFVSDMAVADLFERADAFVFPSLKEGFGLPILEAFHHATPLLAAAAPAIPEVAGDAALFFDPHDVDSMCAALVRFYDEPALAADLVERGRRRLQQFSWVKTAESTAGVYRQVLEQRALAGR